MVILTGGCQRRIGKGCPTKNLEIVVRLLPVCAIFNRGAFPMINIMENKQREELKWKEITTR